MSGALAAGYKSPAQQARVVTESWAAANMYCPSCPSPSLAPTIGSTPVVDFECMRCGQPYQLKSKGSAFTSRVVDGEYRSMLKAISDDATPNLLLLRYDRSAWTAVDLMLIPRFALSASAILGRKPLSRTARRAGWTGCFILLSNIPSDARISLIENGVIASASSVRRKWLQLQPLQQIATKERGWTLDVLTAVRSLDKVEFSNTDVYASAGRLRRLHPRNRHVKDKIRQQLQVLRDAGLIAHVGRGMWRQTGESGVR